MSRFSITVSWKQFVVLECPGDAAFGGLMRRGLGQVVLFKRDPARTGAVAPVMQLRLLLPAPFGPTIASISPCATDKVMSDGAVNPPNRSVIASTLRCCAIIPPPAAAAILLHVAIAAARGSAGPQIEFLHVLVAA